MTLFFKAVGTRVWKMIHDATTIIIMVRPQCPPKANDPSSYKLLFPSIRTDPLIDSKYSLHAVIGDLPAGGLILKGELVTLSHKGNCYL